MAQSGFDVPCSKKPADVIWRRFIFDIISPCCFSNADIAEIATYSDSIQEMWFQSFTNSQVVMIKSKLFQSAKEHFLTFFPDSAIPRPSKARKIGLAPGESILDR